MIIIEREFFDFLRSDKMICNFSYNDDYEMIILKLKCTNKVDILYSLSRKKGELFDLRSPFAYSGIYDREKDILFDTKFSIRTEILNWEYCNEKNIEIVDLYKIINKDVNKKIDELVNAGKKDIFDITGVGLERPITDYDVVHEFFNGKTSNNFGDEFTHYFINKPSAVIDYLTDKKLFVEKEAKDFIHKNSYAILKGLVTSLEKRKALKKIEENKEHIFHKIKDIRDAIKANNCITVNLTICKDDKELTFKYSADTLKKYYSSKWLPIWSIESKLDRESFKETFGENEDFHYKDIVKITHGKKVIYEDKNFKQKEETEEICL